MPSVQKGFLFKYFDKLICGIAAVVLLAGVVYAASRATGPDDVSAQQVRKQMGQLSEKLQGQGVSPQVDMPEVATGDQTIRPVAVGQHRFVWPLPELYPTIKIGTNKEYVLDFRAPLAPGSLQVTPEEEAFKVDLEHPVNGDYRKVLVRTRRHSGTVTIQGREGNVPHTRVIVIDPEVSKVAYPPTEVTANPGVGSIEVSFTPDRRIFEEEVIVRAYEIWRRDWSNPLGEYEFVASVEPGQQVRAPRREGEPSAPGEEFDVPDLFDGLDFQMRSPREPLRLDEDLGEDAENAEPQPQIYPDTEVQPGLRYSYKVRTVGENTFPTKGDFSDPAGPVPALGEIDFKFNFAVRGRVQFEIAKRFPDGQVRTQRVWVEVGDEIGTIRTLSDGTTESYMTGATLVDYQTARRPTGGTAPRVVYSDPRGGLNTLWQNQVRAPSLWEAAAQGSAPGVRRGGGRSGGFEF